MGNGSIFDRRLLQEDYSPRIYAYYFKQWERFKMGFHQHESTEIMYVIQGECLVVWKDASGRETADKLSKGEFVMLDADVLHRLQVEQPCRMLNVEFGFAKQSEDDVFPSIKRIAETESSLGEMMASPFGRVTLRDPDEVFHALKSLVLELDQRGEDGGVLDRMLLSQLFIRISRLWRESRSNGGSASDQYVKRCAVFLRQNYDRGLTIEEVAAHVNLHPGYLQRIFKSQTGQTLIEYLTDVRMEKAKMLLLHTDIPIADISDYVGAGSRQYFHALFKKHTGRTPIEYRLTMDKMKFSEIEK